MIVGAILIVIAIAGFAICVEVRERRRHRQQVDDITRALANLAQPLETYPETPDARVRLTVDDPVKR